MRSFVSFVLSCVILAELAVTQRTRYQKASQVRVAYQHPSQLQQSLRNAYRLGAYNLRQSNGLGPVHFHGAIGHLPLKYQPLTKADEVASAVAASAFVEILRHIPNVLTVPNIGPIDIDLPDLWLRGKLYLSNVVLRGVQQVTLQNLEIRRRNHRVDFVAHGSRVSGEATLDLEGTVSGVPLYLSGSIVIGAQDIYPTGAVGTKKVVLPQFGEVYQVESGVLDVDIQNIQVNINSSNQDDAEIDEAKGQVLDEMKDQIADMILALAIIEVNKELANVPASEIDALLLGNRH